MAKLSPEQQQSVESWAEAGATLNDVQGRLKTEFGLSLTYLDARMLMIEIGVRLKEKVKDAPPEPAVAAAAADVSAPSAAADWNPAAAEGGKVSVTADAVPMEGAIASGQVTFSDGRSAVWFVDPAGRLGLRAQDPAYQPPPADISVFEQQLDALLQGL